MHRTPLLWLLVATIACQAPGRGKDVEDDFPFDPELDTDVEPEPDPTLRNCAPLHPELDEGETSTVTALATHGDQLIGLGATSADASDAFLLDPATHQVTPLDAPGARSMTVVGDAAFFMANGQLLGRRGGMTSVLSEPEHLVNAFWVDEDASHIVYYDSKASHLYRAPAAGGSATQLSKDTTHGPPADHWIKARVGFAGERIVWLTEPEDAPAQLVSADLQGNDLRLLTDPTTGLGDVNLFGNRFVFEISPDGTEVVYSQHVTFSQGHLFRVGTDGTGHGPLHPDDTETPGSNEPDILRWLADGSLLYPRQVLGEQTLVHRRGEMHTSVTDSPTTVFAVDSDRAILRDATGLLALSLDDDSLTPLPVHTDPSSIQEAALAADVVLYRVSEQLWALDLASDSTAWLVSADLNVQRYEPSARGVLLVTDTSHLHHAALDQSPPTALSPEREFEATRGTLQILLQHDDQVWFSHDTSLRMHPVLYRADLATGDVEPLVDAFPPRIAEDMVGLLATEDGQTVLLQSRTAISAPHRMLVGRDANPPCEVDFGTGYDFFFTDLTPSGDSALLNGRRMDQSWTYLRLDSGSCTVSPLIPGETRNHRRAVVSPDGSTIALALTDSDEGEQLFAVDADGANLRRLSDRSVDEGIDVDNDGAAMFAQNGQRVVYAGRDGAMYSVRIDGSDRVRLYEGDDVLDGSSCRAYDITADGEHVLFMAGRFTGGRAYMAPVDGSAPATAVDLGTGGAALMRPRSTACSDIAVVGDRILFRSTLGLFTTDAQGLNPIQLDDRDWLDEPRFVEEQLVYASAPTATSDVRRVPLDGSSPAITLFSEDDNDAFEDGLWGRVFAMPNRRVALATTFDEDNIVYWRVTFDGEVSVLATSDGYLENQAQMLPDHLLYRSSAGLHKVHLDTGEDSLLDFQCGAEEPASWTYAVHGDRVFVTGAFRAPGIVEIFEVTH